MTAILRRLTNLPDEIDVLADEARGEGFDHVGRLVDDWRVGRQRFDRPGERFVGAYLRARLVGIGGLAIDPYLDDWTAGRIQRLYVRPGDRGWGVGRMITTSLVDIARDRFERLRIRTAAAGGFFERFGFAPVEEPEATHAIELPVSRYSFVDYDPKWPDRFARVSLQLRNVLGTALVDVHHVGSTAVPGLAAKPIIDVLPVVRDIDRIDELTAALEDVGFRARGEYGLPGRRYFTWAYGGVRHVNVHVYADDHPDIDRHLRFRDRLRASPEMRDEYEALKRDVYAKHPTDIAAYNAGKDAWIKRHERVDADGTS